jgi:diguanylate cyclase (GGDEF)-like protein
MSRRAWIYIWGIFLAWAVLSGLVLTGLGPAIAQWKMFVVLTTLATLAQLFKFEAPNHQLYYATPVFFFAAILLLAPPLFVILVAVALLIEWAKERMVNSPHLRHWYLQPFNIAMYTIAGITAAWVNRSIDSSLVNLPIPLPIVATVVASLAYVVTNHIIIGLALVLARGISLRESGVLDAETVLTELILLWLGIVVATLWYPQPWLIPLVLSPLLLIQRALMIPQLKQEAQTDTKTGLLNARYLTKVFNEELERARRFNRPLAVIMADLDLLRDVNNTYGHLAGDVVIAGIGQIIRKTIREYDIAGRFGGEEFAVVLPEAGQAEAQAIAERIRMTIEATDFVVSTSPTPIHVTMSLGIACFPDDATTVTELTHQADVAVYQAKSQGRNRVVCAADVPVSVMLEKATAS